MIFRDFTRKCPLRGHCLAPPGWRKRITLYTGEYLWSVTHERKYGMTDGNMDGTSAHPVKMNLNKRFFPGKKSVQTIIFGTQGIRKTMNWNPPTVNFFLLVTRARIEPGTLGLPVKRAIHWATEVKGFQAKNSRRSWFYKIHAKLIIIIKMISFAWIL